MRGMGCPAPAARLGGYIMQIHISASQGVDTPISVQAFGLSLSLSCLEAGCSLVIKGGDDGASVTIERAAAAEPVAEQAAIPEPAALPEAVPVQDAEQELFQKLSMLRKQVAAEAGVPPYVVFHDNTLREMCRLLPEDAAALQGIQGVGKAKLDKYGERFIAAIKEFTGAA